MPRKRFILSFFCLMLAPWLPLKAAENNSAAKIPISGVIAYLNNPSISCNWAGHCRDDLKLAESEYMSFLETGEEKIKTAALDNSQNQPQNLQRLVDEYRNGLQARETLFGRCPGRCLSYDFPVAFRNASRLIAKKNHVGLLLDLSSVHYGADIVLKGADLSSQTLQELRKTAR